MKIFSRHTALGAVFAERFNRTIRNLLKKFVFDGRDRSLIDLLSAITKQYNYRIHSSTNLTPIEASLTKNEGLVLSSFVYLINVCRHILFY